VNIIQADLEDCTASSSPGEAEGTQARDTGFRPSRKVRCDIKPTLTHGHLMTTIKWTTKRK